MWRAWYLAWILVFSPLVVSKLWFANWESNFKLANRSRWKVYFNSKLALEQNPKSSNILLILFLRFFGHSIVRANLNKSEWLVVTNTTKVSKYVPQNDGSRITTYKKRFTQNLPWECPVGYKNLISPRYHHYKFSF